MKSLFTMGLMLLGVLVALTGCDQINNIVIRKEYVPMTFPEKMLRKCPTTVPPSATVYAEQSIDKKEDVLTDYIVQVLKDIDNCNDQLSEIHQLQAKQLTEVEKLNKAEEDKASGKKQ